MKILSGLYKSRSLVAPKGDQTRPTLAKVRSSLFESIQGRIEGTRFLDLFAGSGAMGFEALSRGASFVCWVEKNPLAVHSIVRNIEMLGLLRQQVDVQKKDVLLWLDKIAGKYSTFDWIFADPPYMAGNSRHLIEKIDQMPLLGVGGTFFLETIDVLDGILLQNMQLKGVRSFNKTFLYEYRMV